MGMYHDYDSPILDEIGDRIIELLQSHSKHEGRAKGIAERIDRNFHSVQAVLRGRSSKHGPAFEERRRVKNAIVWGLADPI